MPDVCAATGVMRSGALPKFAQPNVPVFIGLWNDSRALSSCFSTASYFLLRGAITPSASLSAIHCDDGRATGFWASSFLQPLISDWYSDEPAAASIFTRENVQPMAIP